MKFRSILRQSAISMVIANGIYLYTFLCNILLMRLLLPDDFGLVALAVSLVGLIEIVTTFAFRAVLIQQREQRSMVRSVFQLALAVIALKVAIGVVFWLAVRGRYDLVIWQLFWLVLGSKIFSGIGPLLVSRLEKRGNFLNASLVSDGSTGVAVTCAVIAVYLGAGVHGLALRLVLPPVLIFAAMMVFYGDLFPRDLGIVNRRQLRVVGLASTRLYFQSASELIYMRVPLLMIETLFGAATLGLFTQATYLVTLMQRITSVVNNKVAFVFFARNRHDAGESRQGYRWMVLGNVFVTLPVALVFWALAEPIVVGLWGEAWRSAVPFVEVMAVMSLLLPLFSLLKSRLLGLRRNWSITTVYLSGFAFFASGLLIPAPFEPSYWVAALATASYVVMLALLAVFIARFERSGAVPGTPRAVSDAAEA